MILTHWLNRYRQRADVDERPSSVRISLGRKFRKQNTKGKKTKQGCCVGTHGRSTSLQETATTAKQWIAAEWLIAGEEDVIRLIKRCWSTADHGETHV